MFGDWQAKGSAVQIVLHCSSTPPLAAAGGPWLEMAWTNFDECNPHEDSVQHTSRPGNPPPVFAINTMAVPVLATIVFGQLEL